MPLIDPPHATERVTEVDDLAALGQERDRILQSETLDKSVALRVMQLHQGLETLLLRTRHAHNLDQLRHERDAMSVRLQASEQLAAAHNDTVKIERRMEALENFARDLQTARTDRK